MTDRRLRPANGRVALAGTPDTGNAAIVKGQPRRVTLPVTDIVNEPGGRRDRQLVYGASVTLIEDRNGWSFIQAHRDGYTGYVPSGALGADTPKTHRVIARSTHLYQDDSIKSRDLAWLSFGAELEVIADSGKFLKTPDGFVPKGHLGALDAPPFDPVTVARLFMGTPYLWGGNSAAGIDCSGLVQAALLAAGILCPGDSDMQQSALGHDLEPGAPLGRGDLIFWRGHVAMGVGDNRIIHANAFHMAVAEETVDGAIDRIAATGDGPVTRRARL